MRPLPPIPVSKSTMPPSSGAATAQTLPCGTPGQGRASRSRQTPGSTFSPRGASGRLLSLIRRRAEPRSRSICASCPDPRVAILCGQMAAATEARGHKLSAALREGERVMPLELFFDLVFVLAFTQCTALMANHPTWSGLAQGLLVLGMLWWAWVGYAWLTSVIDPEEGA